nr:NAD-dependent histone deacetylase SIR2 [Cryptococcus depauperatus CBS 7841]
MSPVLGEDSQPESVADPLAQVAEIIKSGRAKNVIFLLGAGISTSAGIPDFRSPSTGLYHNLQELDLPFPEAVFELGYFKENPKPFWTLAKEIYPGKHFPTPTHYLLELFNKHNILKRVFTQNIDTLETLADLSPELIVEAHGSFATSHCLKCRRKVDSEEVLRAGVRKGQVVKCDAVLKGQKCNGLIKPDIVFFGEGLPDRFFELIPDLKRCDLLIVIGTSLKVQPFASLVDSVPLSCPRLLINREPVGGFSRLNSTLSSLPSSLSKLLAGSHGTSRDLFFEGDADDGSWKLAEKLGWKDELEAITKAGREKLENRWKNQGEDVEGGFKDVETRAKKVAKALKDEFNDNLDNLDEAINRQLKL